MQGLYEEIRQIPAAALRCYEKNRGVRLPLRVPYIGMGSSYFAALTLFYAGAEIQPLIASEYFSYLATARRERAVLISQSGESSETLWNIAKFEKVVAITNNPQSSLAACDNIEMVVELHAGEELYSSTKTYVNTLVALYAGFGIDALPAIEYAAENAAAIETRAQQRTEEIHRQIQKYDSKGFYILGSGPNYATACEAALTLTETTKLPWNAMPVAQYDHGIKEAGAKSVILACDGYGNDKRIEEIKKSLGEVSNTLVISLGEPAVAESISPIVYIFQLNLMMNYLADLLGIKDIFQFGGKVTTVNSESGAKQAGR